MKNILKSFKDEFRDFKDDLRRRKIKRSIVAFFFAILSILCFSIKYAFIICASMSLIFSLLSIKKRQKLADLSLLIIIVCIGIHIFNYLNRDLDAIDPNLGTNILIGKWQYNDSGGTYIFNDDYTYEQYITDDLTNNYCKGTYKYEYSYETKDGTLVRSDVDYVYYYVSLTHDECLINKVLDTTDGSFDKKMIFGYGKLDPNKSIIININTDNYFLITKKD